MENKVKDLISKIDEIIKKIYDAESTSNEIEKLIEMLSVFLKEIYDINTEWFYGLLEDIKRLNYAIESKDVIVELDCLKYELKEDLCYIAKEIR